MLSLQANSEKEQISYYKPYVNQKASYLQSSQAREKSKSRSKIEKQEKASSIKGSMVKRSKVSESPLYPTKKEESNFEQNMPLEESKNMKSVLISEERKSQSVASFKISHKISPLKEGKDRPSQKQTDLVRPGEDLLASSVVLDESNQKLIKLTKKKTRNNSNLQQKKEIQINQREEHLRYDS